MEILSMDQLRTILDRLEKIELQAISLLSFFRNPQCNTDIFCDYSTILVNLQIKIRDFRSILSKNSGSFNRRKYQEFLDYSNTALEHCDRAARRLYPPRQQENT